MAENEPWRTSVDELMRIFRDALIALLPSLRRARIPWHSLDAYDDWANISETLFEEIVVNSIRWGVHDFEMKVPRYEFSVLDYSSLSFVGVLLRGDTDVKAGLVFNAFDSDDDTFSVIQANEIGADGRCGTRRRVSLDEASFVFQHRQPDGSLVVVSDLSVDL